MICFDQDLDVVMSVYTDVTPVVSLRVSILTRPHVCWDRVSFQPYAGSFEIGMKLLETIDLYGGFTHLPRLIEGKRPRPCTELNFACNSNTNKWASLFHRHQRLLPVRPIESPVREDVPHRCSRHGRVQARGECWHNKCFSSCSRLLSLYQWQQEVLRNVRQVLYAHENQVENVRYRLRKGRRVLLNQQNDYTTFTWVKVKRQAVAQVHHLCAAFRLSPEIFNSFFEIMLKAKDLSGAWFASEFIVLCILHQFKCLCL